MRAFEMLIERLGNVEDAVARTERAVRDHGAAADVREIMYIEPEAFAGCDRFRGGTCSWLRGWRTLYVICFPTTPSPTMPVLWPPRWLGSSTSEPAASRTSCSA